MKKDHFEPPEAVRELFRESQGCPPCVAPIPEMLGDGGFFPGDSGLSSGVRDFSTIEAMFVGQDYGTVKEYEQYKNGESEPDPTEENLCKFLREVGLLREKCFFTNFYPHLRDTQKSTGPFPGENDKKYIAANDEEYVEKRQRFFLRQIAVVQPRLVVILGTEIPKFIACTAKALNVWEKCKEDGVTAKIQNAGQLFSEVNFDGHSAVVCWLLHPGYYRHRNLHLREYEGESGNAAELKLMRDALREAGIEICKCEKDDGN